MRRRPSSPALCRSPSAPRQGLGAIARRFGRDGLEAALHVERRGRRRRSPDRARSVRRHAPMIGAGDGFDQQPRSCASEIIARLTLAMPVAAARRNRADRSSGSTMTVSPAASSAYQAAASVISLRSPMRHDARWFWSPRCSIQSTLPSACAVAAACDASDARCGRRPCASPPAARHRAAGRAAAD